MDKKQTCQVCWALMIYCVLLEATIITMAMWAIWNPDNRPVAFTCLLGLFMASVIGFLYGIFSYEWSGGRRNYMYLVNDQDTVFGVVMVLMFSWALIPIDIGQQIITGSARVLRSTL